MSASKNFLRRLRAAWHPDEYHGWGIQQRYFEGWYFKLVSRDEKHAFAVIPGISFGENGERHAFVQIMDGKACKAYYHKFDVSDFRPSTRTFALELGNNYFSSDLISLDLPGISGEIRFQNKAVWPKMLGAPGIMGWYSFVPFMECNHGVLSMDHQLEGQFNLNLDGTSRSVAFTGGKGYIEKDWGRSFPRAYVWMQSNHFSVEGRASLMASVAHIPWLKSHFIGFISGFRLEDRLFRFATYTGARKYLRQEQESLELVFKQSHQELRIWATQAQGTALVSPLQGDMTGKVNESLQATLQVELLENGKRLFEGTGRNAGLEVVGDMKVLL